MGGGEYMCDGSVGETQFHCDDCGKGGSLADLKI